MTIYLNHFMRSIPQPDDAGTITIHAKVHGYNAEFTASAFLEEFMDVDNDRCPGKEDLNYFLMESGINNDVVTSAMMKLDLYVDEVTLRIDPSQSPPEYALQVYLYIEEDASLESTNKPAHKVVVESLPRRIYDKINQSGEKCTICLEEFSIGRRLVTLPCGHELDDECAVELFATSHFCPVCRYELLSDDE